VSLFGLILLPPRFLFPIPKFYLYEEVLGWGTKSLPETSLQCPMPVFYPVLLVVLFTPSFFAVGAAGICVVLGSGLTRVSLRPRFFPVCFLVIHYFFVSAFYSPPHETGWVCGGGAPS